MVATSEDIPPMVGQGEHGQDGQEKEDGPDPVNDGPENAHEKGWVGSHGTPLGVLLGLLSSPAFAAVPASRGETDVFDHPISCVAKGCEKEKTRKKQAKQKSRDENQGMYAQSPDHALRLSQ
jgi:hypothetical protein